MKMCPVFILTFWPVWPIYVQKNQPNHPRLFQSSKFTFAWPDIDQTKFRFLLENTVFFPQNCLSRIQNILEFALNSLALSGGLIQNKFIEQQLLQSVLVLLFSCLTIYSAVQGFRFITYLVVLKRIMGHSRLNWTPQEQRVLRLLKQAGNFQGWKQISEELNKRFQSRNRTGKQCRERYMNYIKFGEEPLKTSNWTSEQDTNLFQNFSLYGARWVLISKQMPHRSENSLKNRFYGILRKIMRKIEKVIRIKKMKQSKALKLRTLIEVLERGKKAERCERANGISFQDQEDLSGQLSKQLCRLGTGRFQEPAQQEIIRVIRKLYQFLSLKKIYPRKVCLSEKCQQKSSMEPQVEWGQRLGTKKGRSEEFPKNQGKQGNQAHVSLDKILQSYQKAEKEQKMEKLENMQYESQLSLPYQLSSTYHILKGNTYDILDQIEGISYF